MKILVAAHKPCRLPADDCYLPVQAGAALHPPEGKAVLYLHNAHGGLLPGQKAGHKYRHALVMAHTFHVRAKTACGHGEHIVLLHTLIPF